MYTPSIVTTTWAFNGVGTHDWPITSHTALCIHCFLIHIELATLYTAIQETKSVMHNKLVLMSFLNFQICYNKMAFKICTNFHLLQYKIWHRSCLTQKGSHCLWSWRVSFLLQITSPVTVSSQDLSQGTCL